MIDWYSELEELPKKNLPKKTDWYSELSSPKKTQPQSDPAALPQEEPSAFKKTFSSISDFFTGDDRKTDEIKKMDEFDLPFEFSARQAKSALGLMTTFDPKRQASALKENYPDLKFESDENGTIIVDGTMYGGNRGPMNMPGVSQRDLLQAGFQVAGFTPAGKVASSVTRMPARIATASGASAATQVGMDLVNQSTGGTDDVSLSNVSAGDAVLAGLGGGLGEGLAGVFSKAFPYLKKSTQTINIDDNVRDAFKKEAVEAGYAADSVSDDTIKEFISLSRQSVKAKDIPATRNTLKANELMNEFDVSNLTKGQQTLNKKQLNFEDSARHGGLGDSPQAVMGNQQKRLNNELTRSARNVQKRLGNNQLDNINQAGEIIGQGVKREESIMDAAVQKAYDDVGDAYLDKKGVHGIFKDMRNSIRSPDTLYDLKSTSGVMADLRRFENSFLTKNAKIEGIKPFRINQLEGFRKRLNAYVNAAENPTDKMQVLSVKSAFDDAIDSAITNTLFTGEANAMNQLKQARGLARDYFVKFRQNKNKVKGIRVKDEAGQIIEKILANDPTNEQIVSYLFNTSKLFKPSASKTVDRLKQILPNEEFNALREAAFMKLTGLQKGDAAISSAKFSRQLQDALKGDSQTVMHKLFDKSEMKQFERFGELLKRSVSNAQNPSKTSYKTSQLVQQWAKQMGVRFGFLTGDPATIAAIRGVEKVSDRLAKKAVNQSVNYKPKPIINTSPLPAGVAAPASVGLFGY